MLRYQGRLCVLDVDDLRRRVLEEACGSQYSIYWLPPKCIVILERYIGEMF